MLEQPSGTELERIRRVLERRVQRRQWTWAAFAVSCVLALVANASGVGGLQYLVPLCIALGAVATFGQELWWRCPRCHESLVNASRYRLRPLSECPACGLDLKLASRPAV